MDIKQVNKENVHLFDNIWTALKLNKQKPIRICQFDNSKHKNTSRMSNNTNHLWMDDVEMFDYNNQKACALFSYSSGSMFC